MKQSRKLVGEGGQVGQIAYCFVAPCSKVEGVAVSTHVLQGLSPTCDDWPNS